MIIHLIKPKTNDAPNKTDVLVAVNNTLKARKLTKPQVERKLTALELLRQINKALHFAAIRAHHR